MSKIVFDPIHDHIEIDSIAKKIIDTPHFQRLRNIKQLGSCCFVFHGANHTRFEHSIGVYHLTGNVIDHLIRNQPELKITEREKQIVKIAGLCHDMGHGPFSHAFDDLFLKRTRPDSIYLHHEARSILLLEYINKKYLAKIVSGDVDTDKFDYISRDIYYTGLQMGSDMGRLLQQCKVIGNKLCFSEKDGFNIYHLFQTRYLLHKKVYSHPVAMGIEYMIADTLYNVDKYLKISDSIEDPNKFITFTDHILSSIIMMKGIDRSLYESSKIIERIYSRDLYKYIREFYPKIETKKSMQDLKNEIYDKCEKNNIPKESYIIQELSIGFPNNPETDIYYYSQKNSDFYFHMERNKISSLLPNVVKEYRIRLFCKNIEYIKKLQKI
jgi:HD superfamily phosphohydrolase